MKNLKSKLGAPGISTKSSAVYHSPGSTLTQILCRKSMRNALCRWSSYFSWKVWWPYDKYGVWKNGLESKGLKVNMGKTKVMILGRDFHTLQTSGIYPCTVCRKGVGKNSVFCSRYSFWVHKKCFDIPGKLVENPDFMCRRCLGNAWAIDGRPCVEVQLADGKLDVADNFVYLGVCIWRDGCCELATIKRCRSAWGNLRKLTLAYL